MRRFAIVICMCLASIMWSDDDGVDIIDQSQVTALSKVQEQIDSISTAVTDCISSGKGHNDCLCENSVLIVQFKQTVADLFKTYPEFKTLDIVRFKDSNGVWISQSLTGIKVQANLKLTCP